MNAQRQRELALQRERLVLRAGLQRSLLQARCQASGARLDQAGALVTRARGWVLPAALAAVPLLLTLGRGRRSPLALAWRVGRWVWPLWQAWRLSQRSERR